MNKNNNNETEMTFSLTSSLISNNYKVNKKTMAILSEIKNPSLITSLFYVEVRTKNKVWKIQFKGLNREIDCYLKMRFKSRALQRGEVNAE